MGSKLQSVGRANRKKHQMGACIQDHEGEIHGQTVAGHGTAKRQEVQAPGQLEPAALAMGRTAGSAGPRAT